jgi:peptidoglycan/xylan/chitin deacetylase (PgdA/CDA1 family)/glycine betaine/choline ABC-type transport system substrate-binding protein
VRRYGRHRRPPAAVTWPLFAAALLAACTTPGVRPDPPNAPNAVVSSVDRIRDGQIRLGGPHACLEDEWCAAGLSRVYGLQLGSGAIAFDTPAATLSALDAGAVDVGAFPASAVETADPRITLLRDDRSLQPANNVVPVVAGTLATAAGRSLATAVDDVSATFDTAGLTDVERALAGGSAPDLAATDWLDHHPPIPAPVPPPGGAPDIVIGATQDAESQALAHLYAGALSRAGWRTSVQLLASREAALEQLRLGTVGLVPDFTAELLQVLSGYTGAPTTDAFRNRVQLRAALADLGLVAFEPAPAQRTTEFAVSTDVADALSVTSLSDLARVDGAHPGVLPSPAPLTSAQRKTDTEGPLPPPRPTLGVGSAGAQVLADQERLLALGYTGLTPTGNYDEATVRAVSAFQADVGLIADGAVDPATGRALAAAKPGGRTAAHPAPTPGDADAPRPPSQIGTPSVGTIYLAFADGPSPVTTQLISVLSQHGAKATFFAEEGAVAAQPETLEQLMAQGDGIGISTWPHNDASPIASDALWRTVSSTQIAVSAVDGRTPTCFLPPYGSTGAQSRATATGLGLRVVLWDLDPQDWRLPGAAAIADEVILHARPGSVVLLHDGGGDRSQTLAAVQQIVDTLSRLGYNFASIPGC